MIEFIVNPHRCDPYKQFKFRIKCDGKYIAGVSKVSALKRITEVVTHREGGSPNTVHKSPAQTVYEPIILSRGRAARHGLQGISLLAFRIRGLE
jgi:phage tail-like protein